MSESVEFRHLRYIVAVAETGNFTRAAQQLFVSQPALSKQIRDIEEQIGFQVFLRTPDGVFPTPVGQLVVDYAINTLHGHSHLFRMAREIFLGRIPTLRLGFSSFVSPRHIQSFRSRYSRHFPDCVLQLSGGQTKNILDRVERGELDCAIVTLPVAGPQWGVVQIASKPLVACMRADDPLAEQNDVSLIDLSGRLTIFRDPEAHPSAHARLSQMFNEANIDLKISSSAATPHDIQLLVRNRFGFALMSEDAPLESDLATRHIAGVSWTEDTAFVYKEPAQHPAIGFIKTHVLGSSKKPGKNDAKPTRPQPSLQLEFPS